MNTPLPYGITDKDLEDAMKKQELPIEDRKELHSTIRAQARISKEVTNGPDNNDIRETCENPSGQVCENCSGICRGCNSQES